MRAAYAVEPGLGFEVGVERLSMPGVSFGVIKNNFAGGGGTVGTIRNSDGQSDGTRIDLSIGSHLLWTGGFAFSIGAKGFMSFHGAEGGSQGCRTPTMPPPAIPFCTVMPLFDPTRSGGIFAAFNSVFDTPGETITFAARREAAHRGAALEIELPIAGSPAAADSRLSLVMGPAWRHLGHELNLTARGVGPTGTSTGRVAYGETLGTDYLGGYLGFDGKLHLGHGFSLVLAGEIGIYRASTSYSGHYAASGATQSGNPAANLSQALSLKHTELAAIAALKLGAEQDLGLLRAGIFARAEYYSYAPAVAYNDVDFTGTAGQNLVGSNDGTRLRKDDAISFSAGARIVVPLSKR